jgi:hypothetical protein
MISEEECYEALNRRIQGLIGYHNSDSWQSKPIIVVMEAYREVERFLFKFPNCFLAKRWKSTITGYLIHMNAALIASEAVAPSAAESAMTLARATSSSNVTSMSVLQAHDVQHQLSRVGGSRQIVP